MSCGSAKRQMRAYNDGELRRSDHSRLMAHLRRCDSCASSFEQRSTVRSELGALPKPLPPDHLAIGLRVIASRERQNIEQTRGSRLRLRWDRWKFRVEQMMRPLTIPAAGGLISSMILFACFGFTIWSTARPAGYEVPIAYTDHAGANLVPVQLRSAVVLTMSLDGNGHIIDYAVRDGSESFTGDVSRLQHNNIPVPQFPTVLALAEPVSSDISISLTPLVFRQ